MLIKYKLKIFKKYKGIWTAHSFFTPFSLTVILTFFFHPFSPYCRLNFFSPTVVPQISIATISPTVIASTVPCHSHACVCFPLRLSFKNKLIYFFNLFKFFYNGLLLFLYN